MNPVDKIAISLNSAPTRISPPTERCAAVAVVICDGKLLFIKRAKRSGDPWSGHIAFPGGVVERSDKNKRSAAQRETMEEVGIDLSRATLLGELNELQTLPQLPPLTISSFVFDMTDTKVTPHLNYEVDEILFHPISELLDPSSRSTFQYQWNGNDITLPCIHLPIGRLWGLTLRIVDDLLARAHP